MTEVMRVKVEGFRSRRRVADFHSPSFPLLAEAGFQIVERRNLDAVLREQENAVTVGMFLAASYVLTGAVMEMEESVVIFSRIINVETAVIETAAQVIVPMQNIAAELLQPPVSSSRGMSRGVPKVGHPPTQKSGSALRTSRRA